MIDSKIVVIGAGVMGNGIAQVSATARYQVVLQDVSEVALDKALGLIKRSLERFVKKDKLSPAEAKEVLGRIALTQELPKAVENADYVIEAVPEILELKIRVIKEIDSIVPKHCIIGSNTSQYSITALAAATERPDRVIGVHFFNPPVMMRLIEVVKGLQTSEDTIQATLAIAAQMKKEVVMCKDSQGFITSRLINVLLAEAERILEEGIATAEDIDKACRLAFNHPMGPFELGDFSGLDTHLNVTKALEEAYGSQFKPTQTLRNNVSAGRLGRKSGRGYYNYSVE